MQPTEYDLAVQAVTIIEVPRPPRSFFFGLILVERKPYYKVFIHASTGICNNPRTTEIVRLPVIDYFYGENLFLIERVTKHNQFGIQHIYLSSIDFFTKKPKVADFLHERRAILYATKLN